MTQAQAQTREQWESRAIELAEVRHLTGTARLLAENKLHAFYGVRKDSAPVGEYLVRIDQLAGAVHSVCCDCPAGQHGRACKHAGATLHALRQRERAISHPDTDVLASWRRGFEW